MIFLGNRTQKIPFYVILEEKMSYISKLASTTYFGFHKLRYNRKYLFFVEYNVMIFWLLACGTKNEDQVIGKTYTYYKDVQPILAKHCVRCHHDGGQGVGDFLDEEDVVALAPQIMSSIESGSMPPPASDPECHDYIGSDFMFLPDEKKEVIRKWVEQGSPLGDISDEQPTDALDLLDVELQTADLIVTIQEPYTPEFNDESNPGNEYRCFALEHNREEAFYITALHPIIDQTSMVHHVVLAKAKDDSMVNGSKRAKGANCIDDGAFISDFSSGAMLGGWAPGMQPIELPEGVGILIQPDDYIVIQMHYYKGDNPEGTSDQSGYTFRTTDQVEHVAQMFPFGFQNFTIPAGDEAYTKTTSIGLPFDIKIWGIFPHMHVLGSAYKTWIAHEDGDKTCLAESKYYDFENQLQYIYEYDEELSKDDKLKISCTWNNSTSNPDLIHNPPIDIGYGERTDEEMCYAFGLISFN
jgi:hypothetical protein